MYPPVKQLPTHERELRDRELRLTPPIRRALARLMAGR
jgi:hypothetical protein